jgi:hypothetical protein
LQSVSVVETISWLHAFVVQFDPELHQQADNPESPLKAEQTPVELPVYAEHEELGVTQPPFPLKRQPFKNVSQSES